MGKLIVIEGLDGSGKATQSKLLFNHLLENDYNVKKFTFPDYESPSSELVKMYLSGEFGNKPNDVNAYTASLFYAVDRFASFKKKWKDFYDDGGIIVADRYTTSNAVYQCSKLPKQDWNAYLEWLFDLEYNKIVIPKPDKVIYLDVTPEVSQKLLMSRYNGDETQKDIHEKNINFLNNSRNSALYCVDKFNWEIIKCDDNNNMYSIEEISKKIIKSIDTCLK